MNHLSSSKRREVPMQYRRTKENKESSCVTFCIGTSQENPRVPEYEFTKEQEEYIKEFQRSFLMKRREEFQNNYECSSRNNRVYHPEEKWYKLADEVDKGASLLFL